MDGAGASGPCPSRRAAAAAQKPRARARVKPPRVQVLVAGADIQTGALKAEVEKGSVRTAPGHGLVGPERRANAAPKGKGDGLRRAPPQRSKGSLGMIPEPGGAERVAAPKAGGRVALSLRSIAPDLRFCPPAAALPGPPTEGESRRKRQAGLPGGRRA